MEPFDLAPWRLRVDPPLTRRAYAWIWAGCAEACRCVECQNYIKLRNRAFYGAALRRLWQLGISTQRDISLTPIGPDPLTDRYVYDGCFLLFGRMEAGEPASPDREPGHTGWRAGPRRLNDCLAVSFGEPAGATVPPSFGGGPLLALRYEVHLPWALDVLPPGLAGPAGAEPGAGHRARAWTW